jgi:hypothetical protein
MYGVSVPNEPEVKGVVCARSVTGQCLQKCSISNVVERVVLFVTKFHLQSLMKLLLINTSLEWDFQRYVTPRLLTQATALTSCSKAPLSAVTKEPAAVKCIVPSELCFHSIIVPGASVNTSSRVRVITTVMILMILL